MNKSHIGENYSEYFTRNQGKLKEPNEEKIHQQKNKLKEILREREKLKEEQKKIMQ